MSLSLEQVKKRTQKKPQSFLNPDEDASHPKKKRQPWESHHSNASDVISFHFDEEKTFPKKPSSEWSLNYDIEWYDKSINSLNWMDSENNETLFQNIFSIHQHILAFSTKVQTHSYWASKLNQSWTWLKKIRVKPRIEIPLPSFFTHYDFK